MTPTEQRYAEFRAQLEIKSPSWEGAITQHGEREWNISREEKRANGTTRRHRQPHGKWRKGEIIRRKRK